MVQYLEIKVLTFVCITEVILFILTLLVAYGRHFLFKKPLFFNNITDFVTVYFCHAINVFFRKNRSRFFCTELRFKYANDVAER